MGNIKALEDSICELKKNSLAVKYILSLFVITRIVLILVGIVSLLLLPPSAGRTGIRDLGLYTGNFFIDMWGVWDTSWYLRIANGGYPNSQYPNLEGHFAFFPLYPMLISLLGTIAGNAFLAGIIISNVSLLVSCVFLYRLVRLDSSTETSLNAVKYLFVFPTSFLLSAVLSESLFLALLLVTFYYAKKGEWLLVGIFGFFLSLARPLGVFMFFPLLFEYFRSKNFKKNKIGKEILYLSLLPLGLFSFSAYNYLLTGDFLAFSHVQEMVWDRNMMSFVEILQMTLTSKSLPQVFNSVFVIINLLVLLRFRRRLSFHHTLAALLLIFIPLTFVDFGVFLASMSRFLVVVFPLYILFAKLGENTYFDQVATASFALLQGFLMLMWVSGAVFTV